MVCQFHVNCFHGISQVSEVQVPIFTVRNEVVKVMFLQVSVCPRGHAIPVCIAGGIPACLATGLQWGVPACSGGVPALGGSGPRGRGLVLGGMWRPPRKQTATVVDGTHPTGMHSCMFHVPTGQRR